MRQAGAEPIWVNAPDADYACNHANCLTKGSYRMGMRCDNCAARFIGRFTKGHEADDRRDCSRCGCKRAISQGYLP